MRLSKQRETERKAAKAAARLEAMQLREEAAETKETVALSARWKHEAR